MLYKGKRCKCVSTWLLILRVVLGLIFIYHGVTKFNNPGMADFVGWAAHKVGLTFLSTEVWFNLVKYVEVIGGVFLILGLWTCLAALALFVVMMFAINTKWWSLDKSELDMVIAGALLSLMFTSGGRFALTHKKKCCSSCKGGSCCNCVPGCKCCKDGICTCPAWKCNCTDRNKDTVAEKVEVDLP